MRTSCPYLRVDVFASSAWGTRSRFKTSVPNGRKLAFVACQRRFVMAWPSNLMPYCWQFVPWLCLLYLNGVILRYVCASKIFRFFSDMKQIERILISCWMERTVTIVPCLRNIMSSRNSSAIYLRPWRYYIQFTYRNKDYQKAGKCSHKYTANDLYKLHIQVTHSCFNEIPIFTKWEKYAECLTKLDASRLDASTRTKPGHPNLLFSIRYST